LNVMFVNNTVFFLLLLFSGANLPLEKMPGWMQTISQFLPLTRGIHAARLLANGVSLSYALSLLVGELAIGGLYAVLGYVLLRLLENIARRLGTLDAF